jgi:hypothetical protein
VEPQPSVRNLSSQELEQLFCSDGRSSIRSSGLHYGFGTFSIFYTSQWLLCGTCYHGATFAGASGQLVRLRLQRGQKRPNFKAEVFSPSCGDVVPRSPFPVWLVSLPFLLKLLRVAFAATVQLLLTPWVCSAVFLLFSKFSDPKIQPRFQFSIFSIRERCVNFIFFPSCVG